MAGGAKYGSEEIIPKRREAEALMSLGATQGLAAKQTGASTQTRIRGRIAYGGLRKDQTKRLHELETLSTPRLGGVAVKEQLPRRLPLRLGIQPGLKRLRSLAGHFPIVTSAAPRSTRHARPTGE